MSEEQATPARDMAVIRKEERKQERLKAKIKAFRSNMKAELAAAMSEGSQKARIAREMIEAKDNPDRIKQMKDQIWGGPGDDITGYGDIPDALKHHDDDELI